MLNRQIMIDERMDCTRYWEFRQGISRIPLGPDFRAAASVGSPCRLAIEAIAIGSAARSSHWDCRLYRSEGLVRASALEVKVDSRERPETPDGVACRSEGRPAQPCHPSGRRVGDATEGPVAVPEASGWVRKHVHAPGSKLVACGRGRRKQRQCGISRVTRRISHWGQVSSPASLSEVEVVTDVRAE